MPSLNPTADVVLHQQARSPNCLAFPQALRLRELQYRFQGCLPELVVDESRVSTRLMTERQDPLQAGQSVKALCFDLHMPLVSSKLSNLFFYNHA